MRDKEDELVRRLFAEATIILEDAHEVAIRGQAQHLDAGARRLAAQQLAYAAHTLKALARTAALLSRDPDHG